MLKKLNSLITLEANMYKFLATILLSTTALTTNVSADQVNPLNLHNGYWVTKVNPPGLGPKITVINDMHVDPETMRVTVYAQSRVFGRVVSPPQLNPDECTETRNGDIHCFHPDAVYLNGTGQELDQAMGDGAWWVKHSWVLGGEGYCNTELVPKEIYGHCLPVKGILLKDGLTMKVGGEDPTSDGYAKSFYNERGPVVDGKNIRYKVARFEWDENNPESDPTLGFELIWDCKREKSAFDNIARDCPLMNE